MRNETKIGILLVVCIVGLVWGLKFLKGLNILKPSQTFYAEYDYAQLNPSTPVKVSGVQVGVVTDVYLKPEDLKTVVVEITVENRINVPKNTIIQIVSSSLLGDKVVRLKFDRPCNGADCAESGDYLPGENIGIVESMIDTESIDDIMGRVKVGAAGVFDTLSYKMSEGGTDSKAILEIKSIISNMDQMTRQINSLLYKSSSSISSMMQNLDTITGNIARNNTQITNIIANAEKLTKDLSESDLSGAVDSTKMIMSTANKAMAQFETTLASSKEAMEELTKLFGSMNDSEGTLGKMLKDDAFYDNMTSATRNLDLLLQDFRLNPKRYTTILKRKSKEYVVPEEDPAKKN